MCIRVTATAFSVVHLEYHAVTLLGLFCGSGLSSVRINTTFVVWRPQYQYPVTLSIINVGDA